MVAIYESPEISHAPTTDSWDAFVAAQPSAHILQTSGWGALKSRFGWASETVRTQDGGVQSGALVLFRRIPARGPLGLTLAYVPRGPLVNWQDYGAVERALTAVTECARVRGASVLKIEPELADTLAHRRLLHKMGFRPSPQTVQPRSSVTLDIAGDEEAILQRMKSKWRYNVRLAGRKGVTVREMARSDLPALHEMMQTTGERDGFTVHSPAYYEAAFELLAPRHAAFLLAEHEGQPLASIVVCAVGKTAWYLWGASSNRERNRMPNHALQWAGIQWARAQGASTYDLWGVPDEIGQIAVGLQRGSGAPTVEALDVPVDTGALPEGELWGVWRFKQGFGGQVVRTVGAWDRAIEPVGAKVYWVGYVAREKISHWQLTTDHRPFNAVKQVGRAVRNSQWSMVNSQWSKGDRGDAAGSAETILQEDKWQRLLGDLPVSHVLQSWTWGQVKAQTGWHAERLVLGDFAAPQAAFQFLWREPLRIPLLGDWLMRVLPLRIGYVPKGPLLDWSDGAAVAATLAAMEQHARRRGCLFVKIDPDVREDSEAGRALVAQLRARGWQVSGDQIQFKNTAVTDLTPSEDDLLGAMKSKWRYNIRLATKRGVTVREITGAQPDDLRAFYTLYAETGARDGFLIRPFGYYETVWNAFLAAQSDGSNQTGGALLLAEHAEEDAPLAGIFLMRQGDTAWYFYGASSERRRRDMPNYLLQWEAMCWAKAQGCTRYDWWGAPTNVDDTDDAMQGVWRFKQGFGADFVPHLGAWDFATSPLLYKLYTQAAPRLLVLLKSRGGTKADNSS